MPGERVLKPAEVHPRLRERGQMFATSEEIAVWLGCDPSQVAHRLRRQRENGRMMNVANGGWVPAQNNNGSPFSSPLTFLDALMKHHGCTYHVTGRSAGRFYGATHQRSVRLNVMADKPIRSRWLGGRQTDFLHVSDMGWMPTETFTRKSLWSEGPVEYQVVVSSRELLLLEAVRWQSQTIGNYDHLADLYLDMLSLLNWQGDGVSPTDEERPIDAGELARLSLFFPEWVRQVTGYMLDWSIAHLLEVFEDARIMLDTEPLRATMPADVSDAHIGYEWPDNMTSIHNSKWNLWRYLKLDPNTC